jgi:hypothetical protein
MGKIEGRIELKGRRGRRSKQLLDRLKEKQDAGNCKRTHYIAFCGKLVEEKVMDLS